jgi:hypothetical protein
MNEQDLQDLEMQVREARLRADQEHTQNMQQEISMEGQDRSIISEQLNLGEELDRIDYLLRGYTIERDEKTGASSWVKPDNNDLIVLSDYGVHLIRNTIAWYLNKNTLLSNYDEETIRNKMEDFSNDLNDTIFMEYEKVFQYPTLEDCKGELMQRIKSRVDVKVFAIELMGERTVGENERREIEERILVELEPVIEKELRKIKEQKIKNKLKRFLILVREVQDAIHSTYLRAFGGQERRTLREHIHISENKGGIIMPQNREEERKLFRRR